MTRDQDIAAFDERAHNYESGRLGTWHAGVARRTVDVALAAVPVPLRVLDLGCGTGLVSRELIFRLPSAVELVGVDPAPAMLEVARERSDGRIRFRQGVAEELPFDDEHFDLIVSTLSFDHWADQSRGLAEVARVLRPDGHVVLADLCAGWLRATLRGERSDKARTPQRMRDVITGAGLEVVSRTTVSRVLGLPLVRAFVAVR